MGSGALVKRVCDYLRSQSTSEHTNKPYAIPVGGSNAIGSWGYIEGVRETLDQWQTMRIGGSDSPSLDHVVFACGSGGTAAGIALGISLAYEEQQVAAPQVHAVGVCDDPEYFYDYVASIADDMGLMTGGDHKSKEYIRQHMTAHQGKGLGYAISTQEELDFVTNFAIETGIVLDPVYSGKALYHFFTSVLQEDPERFRGSNVLFWHTGGALGMYDKGSDLLSKLKSVSPVKRLDVYGKDENDGMTTI